MKFKILPFNVNSYELTIADNYSGIRMGGKDFLAKLNSPFVPEKEIEWVRKSYYVRIV